MLLVSICKEQMLTRPELEAGARKERDFDQDLAFN